MNTKQMQSSPQMATPINTLPLKTAGPDPTDIDDPMIQNVLKEFEDEMSQHQSQQQPQHQSQQQPQYQSQPVHIEPLQPMNVPVNNTVCNLRYNADKNNVIDFDLVKKAVILSVIVLMLQNYDIVNNIIAKIPVIQKYLSGKELFVNLGILTSIFYLLMYLQLL
jgi:hypothetical protein